MSTQISHLLQKGVPISSHQSACFQNENLQCDKTWNTELTWKSWQKHGVWVYLLFLSGHSICEIPSTKNSAAVFVSFVNSLKSSMSSLDAHILGAGVEVSTVAETFNLDPEVVEEVNRVQVPRVDSHRNWSEDFECAWFGSWQFLVSPDVLSRNQFWETHKDFDPWLELSIFEAVASTWQATQAKEHSWFGWDEAGCDPWYPAVWFSYI